MKMPLEEAAALLEEDMRRYIFDKTPERRRQCLDRYRERLGLPKWADAQQAKFDAAQAAHDESQGKEQI